MLYYRIVNKLTDWSCDRVTMARFLWSIFSFPDSREFLDLKSNFRLRKEEPSMKSVCGQPSWTISGVGVYSQLMGCYICVSIKHYCTSWTKVTTGSCSNIHENKGWKSQFIYVCVQFLGINNSSVTVTINLLNKNNGKNFCGKYRVSYKDIYLFSASIFLPLWWHKYILHTE